MNLILINQDEINSDLVVLNDRRSDHIRKILKAGPGDIVKAGIINGDIGYGTIESVAGRSVTLRVKTLSPPPPPVGIDLVLALPRPIMLKRVLAQAAAMGVENIHLINANRVEKSFFNSSIIKDKKYLPFLLNGLEQSVDTRLPEVIIHHRFRPFVEDVLPSHTAYSHRLIAHPDGDGSLNKAVSLPLKGKVILAIGPEGGWVDFEVKKFKQQGFRAFSLGPRILRVDTAVPAIISQINLLRDL